MFLKKILFTLSIVFFILILAVSAPVSAEETTQQKAGIILPKPQVEYSADNSLEIGGASFSQKIYYTPDRERRDTKTDEGTQIIIIRTDRKVSWHLISDQKMYMDMNVMKGRIKMNDILSYYRIVKTPDGEEVINNIPAQKSKVAITDPRGRIYDGLMWTSKENIVLKIEAAARDNATQDRLRIELTNLHIEKQDPGLFEIPEGYAKTVILPGSGSILKIPVK
ncbi:MAG: hypothetical protein C4538_07500 [Nitrospiraceae bacterium]|nr:MAG: hypothetical protein C4538_07500 [Nitrospiraceae bacterium]